MAQGTTISDYSDEMEPDEKEETKIRFFLEAFLKYISRNIDWKDLLLDYHEYTPGKTYFCKFNSLRNTIFSSPDRRPDELMRWAVVRPLPINKIIFFLQTISGIWMKLHRNLAWSSVTIVQIN